jgi:hypothetical protein
MLSMPPPLRLPAVDTIDAVIEGIQSIIDWAISTASPVGYFAAMYKRSTNALREAIDEGVFEDGPRMARFIVTFAGRYFDAVDSHFNGGDDRKPTQVWQVAFEANDNAEQIIFQHMLTAMNAHDTFDLGVTAAAIAGNSLEPLRNDFNAVNAILTSQADRIVEAIERVSPVVAQYRKELIGNDIGSMSAEFKQSRDLAWSFAQQLCAEPESNRTKVIHDHDTIFAWFVRRHMSPPPPISDMVNAIAKEESRDTAQNISVLNQLW